MGTGMREAGTLWAGRAETVAGPTRPGQGVLARVLAGGMRLS